MIDRLASSRETGLSRRLAEKWIGPCNMILLIVDLEVL